jgi:hypothetical protein
VELLSQSEDAWVSARRPFHRVGQRVEAHLVAGITTDAESATVLDACQFLVAKAAD